MFSLFQNQDMLPLMSAEQIRIGKHVYKKSEFALFDR